MWGEMITFMKNPERKQLFLILIRIVVVFIVCYFMVPQCNCLLSNIIWFGVSGIVLLFLSFIPIPIKRPKIFWLALICILITVAGIMNIMQSAKSSPGGEETVDIDKRPHPMPQPVGLLESLHCEWDSTANPPNWPVAELLALVSEKAYLLQVEAEDSYRVLGFDHIETFKSSSMSGYVVSRNDDAIIAFRGTDEPADWFVNLDILTSRTSHGKIHSGFYDSYRQLKPQIITVLKQIKPKHLWITGHSLGGALALTCAYDLVAKEEHNLDGVITFGQPMVASRQLAEYIGEVLDRRYAHYVNDNDIVPRVAPGYAHCGSLVWFTDGKIKVSKRQVRTVAVPGEKGAKQVEIQATRELSEAEFHNIEDKLRGADMMNRVSLGATGAVDVTYIDVNEFASFDEKQFKQIKADLRNEKSQSGRRGDGRPIVRGNTPWLRDHSMSRYVKIIQTYFGNTESK